VAYAADPNSQRLKSRQRLAALERVSAYLLLPNFVWIYPPTNKPTMMTMISIDQSRQHLLAYSFFDYFDSPVITGYMAGNERVENE
jgi:hypothetical protein